MRADHNYYERSEYIDLYVKEYRVGYDAGMIVTVIDDWGPIPGTLISVDEQGDRWIPSGLDGGAVILGTRLKVIRVKSIGYAPKTYKIRSRHTDSLVVRLLQSDVTTRN